MKKILIMGGSGFIGKNLSLKFSKIFTVTSTYFENKPKEKQFLKKNIKWIKIDLSNSKEVKKILKNNYDYIIQAAAFTAGVKVMINDPYSFIAKNAIMNSIILKNVAQSKTKHFIFLSCTVMYHHSKKSLREKDFDYYKTINRAYEGIAYTKLYVENLCRYYSKTSKIRFTALRHSNIYGPYDKFFSEKSHFVPATLSKFLSKKKIINIWGSGEEKRDFLFIEDLISAIKKIFNKQRNSFEIFNVSYGKSYSIKEIVNLTNKISTNKKILIFDKIKPTLKINILVNSNKLKKLTGWKPKISVNDGITKTFRWAKKNYL
tara:strand:- start:15038 stop:15991 length:954 start_codon:yes stop_codon:yes gene_type:complete